MNIREVGQEIVMDANEPQTYIIGFNGNDQTTLDAYNLDDLVSLWSELCDELETTMNDVDYINIILKPAQKLYIAEYEWNIFRYADNELWYYDELERFYNDVGFEGIFNEKWGESDKLDYYFKSKNDFLKVWELFKQEFKDWWINDCINSDFVYDCDIITAHKDVLKLL